MAAQVLNGPIALTTEALFYGRPVSSSDNNSVTAEEFYDKMNAYRLALPLNPQQAIIRTANNFRAAAHLWWTQFVHSPFGTFDRNAANTDWDYFTQIFKRQYYKVQEIADAVADIADVKQEANEDTASYLARLYAKLNPQVVLSIAHTNTQLNAVAVPQFATAEFAAFLGDPVANVLDAAARTAGFTAAVRAALHYGARVRASHGLYEQILRTAARLCRNDKMKIFLRKSMFVNADDRDISAIMDRVRREEASYRQTAFTSGSGNVVNAIEDFSTPSGEQFAAEHSEDEGDEDASYGIHTICAVSGRPKFVKKPMPKGNAFSQFLQQRKQFKGKSNKGRGQGKRGPSAWSFKCFACRLNSHEAIKCDQLRKNGWTKTGNANKPVDNNKSFPKHKYNNSGRRRDANEDAMDTSAVEQQQQQMQQQQLQMPQPQQPQQYAPAQPQQFAPQPVGYYDAAAMQYAGHQQPYTVPPPSFYNGSGNA